MPPEDPKNPKASQTGDILDMLENDPDFAEVNALGNDPKAVQRAIFKKNRDKTAEKLVRTVYYSKSIFSKEYEHDWLMPDNGGEFPKKSCFSKPNAPGQWYMSDLEQYGYPGSVQGWKMHVGCHPLDLIAFFTTIAPLLNRHQVQHKFHAFATQYSHEVGYHVDYKQGEGKTCVIYPNNPNHLVEIVQMVEAEIVRANALHFAEHKTPRFRPYPGGVPGTMDVGRTGFIGVRYGGFIGPLADKSQLFDVRKFKVIADPRGTKPYPDFITSIPDGIRQIKAR